MAFPSRDIRIVHELAHRVAEIAANPIHEQRAAMWRRFNALQPERPMVLIFPEGAWREMLLVSDLLCTDDMCRGWEGLLRQRIYYWDHLPDDNVVEATIRSPIVVRSTGWGLQVQRRHPDEATGADHFESVIVEESDLDKLHPPQVTVDWEATEQRYQQTCEVFDGILPVEMQTTGATRYALVDLFSQWRGLEQLFWDMVDRPQWLHRALQFLTDAHLSVLDQLAEQGALTLNNGPHYCGSGGVGFSDELPQPDLDGGPVRPIDLWGFATTQIFSEVSPEMHEEFALQYERQWLERFGLNAYGCCEPLHHKLDYVKKIPRLRRVSMSPWADCEAGAEQLQDRYIFSRKPNPAVLAGETWEPEAARRDLVDCLEKTRGCVVELIMKDTHTCRNEPERMWEWVRIAKEEAERFAA